MKKIMLFVVMLISVSVTFAQVSKTINLTKAGNLSAELTSEELASITSLTITGIIDARDFKTMRDLMPVLANVDLNGTTIMAYTGSEGTSKSGGTIYAINTVPENAFESKSSLKSIVFPSSMSEISQKAFLSCSGLQTVTFPLTLLYIKDQAFGWCYNLTSISLPESLKSIGYQSFATTNISTVNIPASVESIGTLVFYQCRNLQEINVSVLNEKYCSLEGVLFNKDHTELMEYPQGKQASEYTLPTGVRRVLVRAFNGAGLAKITIPEGVEEIMFEAFANLSNLTAINIPSSVKTIQGGAFAYNQKLMSIIVNRAIPLSLNGYGVFEGINKITCILNVPSGSKTAYQTADQWKDFQNIIALGEITLNIETPGSLANLLTPEMLNRTVVLTLTGNIDARDFRIMRDSMPNLVNVDLSGISIKSYEGTDGTYTPYYTQYPDNEIPQYAFISKGTLKNFKMPESAESIAKYSFAQTGLTTIQFPPSIKVIEERAFWSCNGLNTINIPTTVYKVGNYAFLNCENLYSAIIGCSRIEPYAFRNCRNLSDIQLQETVDMILSMAFADCSGLAEISIPTSVYFIGEGIFANSPVSVTVNPVSNYFTSNNGILYDKEKKVLIHHPKTLSGSFVVPETIVNIGDYAFYNCTQLTSIGMSSLIEYIGNFAFYSCSGLPSIVIPNKVNFIGNSAFANCTGLLAIYAKPVIPFDFTNIVNPFLNVNTTTSKLIVPVNSVDVYKNTQYWKDFTIEADVIPMTYVPDDNFEQTLINMGYDSGPLNDSVPTANISSVTTLSLHNKNIADLAGIEDFTKLEKLYLSGNQLTSLDVSKNTLLKVLHCQNNQLTSLDVSQNTALTELAPNFNQLTNLDLSKNLALLKVFCQSNQISKLDVSNNISLSTLICGANQLTSLDVSNNIALVFLACENNKITSLDLSNNHALGYLYCNINNLVSLNIRNGNNANMTGNGKGLNTSENPNLLCIQVDNPEFASTYTEWQKDPQASYSTDCRQKTYVPDDNFEQALIDLGYDSGSLDDYVPTDEISVVTTLNVSNKGISDLTGIEGFSNLQTLQCYGNKLSELKISDNLNLLNLVCDDNFLTNIDLTKNTELISLSFSRNYLMTSIDVSKNQKLNTLWCDNNKIETINLANNPLLVTLYCNKTLLSSLDISQNLKLFSFDATGNPNLFCIQVYDITIANTKKYWKKDPQASYSTDCNQAPVANAGSDQTVNENTLVNLDGSGSFDLEGEELTWLWTAPAGIILSSETAVNPSFTAPEVLSNTVLLFTLIVNDGKENSVADTVYINVKHVNKAPVAHGGYNQFAIPGELVTLNGYRSSDSDGDLINYHWIAPENVPISGTTSQKARFVAPDIAEDTQYMFILVVNDGKLNSAPDTVYVTVLHNNKIPVANAGEDQTVNEGTLTTLNGSASTDADNDNLTYYWTTPDGVFLQSATEVNPNFTAPYITSDTLLLFTLTVNDGKADSKPDSVFISVKQVNIIPIANAGADQTVNEGDLVSLNGGNSTDEDNDALSWFWTSSANILLSSETVKDPTFTTPEVTCDTVFLFTLTVNDGVSDSKPDSLFITVKHINKIPVANAGEDQTVTSGKLVTLNGTASYDPDNENITYNWIAPEGIMLSSPTASNPTFIPVTDVDTNYIFTLTVTDDNSVSLPDEIKINVRATFATINLKTLLENAEATNDQVFYEIFKKMDDKFSKVNISGSNSGNITSFKVEPGTWLILAVPIGSASDYVPTYFGNQIDWSSAQLITLENDETFSGSIVSNPITGEEQGNYSIEGFIYENMGNKKAVITTAKLSGSPLPGVSVLLFTDGGNIPVQSTITDNTGKYIFEKLSAAKYKVQVEIPGFSNTNDWEVEVKETQPVVTNINFTVITNIGIITDIGEKLTRIRIYPNPTTGILYIDNEELIDITSVEVFTSSGVCVIKTSLVKSPSLIDLSNSVDGVYFVNVTSNTKNEVFKIILKK